jgi:hypothetical protein
MIGLIDRDAKDPTEVNDLKEKIWEAELAQRNCAAGLPHCSELNGTNFYFYPRRKTAFCHGFSVILIRWRQAAS